MSKIAKAGMMVACCFLFATTVFAQVGQFEITNNSGCAVTVELEIYENSTICGQGILCTVTNSVTVNGNGGTAAIQPVCGTDAYWAKAIFTYAGNTYTVDCGSANLDGYPICTATGDPMTFEWINSNVAVVYH